MPPALRFPLTEVLDLAEHAVAAADYASPVADEPDSPALLLVVDYGISPRSNGLPALAPTANQAGADTLRVVYADRYGPGTPWLERVQATGSEEPFTVGLPLRDEYRLLHQLRDAARRGFTTLTVHLRPGILRVGVSRHAPDPHRPVKHHLRDDAADSRHCPAPRAGAPSTSPASETADLSLFQPS